jgi:ParB/RepB/Spo0J family partition protein
MTTAAATLVQNLPLDHVQPDPNQPRKSFDEEALQELANSIKEHGVMQPIVVRPQHEGEDISAIRPALIIAGERRYRACRLANLETAPCIVRTGLSAQDIAVLQVLENLQRQNLTLNEYAVGVSTLVDQIGPSETAKQLGKSKAWVSRRAAITGMPEEIRQLVSDGHVRDVEILHDLVKLQTASARRFNNILKRIQDPEWTSPTRQDVRREVKWAEQEVEAKEKAKEYRQTEQGQKEAESQKARDKRLRDNRKQAERVSEETAALEQTTHATLQGMFKSAEITVRGPYISEYGTIPKSGEEATYLLQATGTARHIYRLATAFCENGGGVNFHLPKQVTRNELAQMDAIFGSRLKVTAYRQSLPGKDIEALLHAIEDLHAELPAVQAAPQTKPAGDISYAFTFLQARTTIQQGSTIAASDMRQAYEDWCASDELEPLSPNVFAVIARDFGAELTRTAKQRLFTNIAWTDQ